MLTGRIGKPGSLGADDIRALISAGMRIGSHGVAHQRLGQALREGTGRRTKFVEGDAGGNMRRARSICSDTVRALQRRCFGGTAKGWLRGCIFERRGQHGESAFLRPRTSIRRDTTDLALEAILSGRASAWRRLREPLPWRSRDGFRRIVAARRSHVGQLAALQRADESRQAALALSQMKHAHRKQRNAFAPKSCVVC